MVERGEEGTSTKYTKEMGLGEEIYKKQQKANDGEDMNSSELARKIPSVNKYITKMTKLAVNSDIKDKSVINYIENLVNSYKEGKATEVEVMKSVSNTLLKDQTTETQKIRYLPTVLNTVSEWIDTTKTKLKKTKKFMEQEGIREGVTKQVQNIYQKLKATSTQMKYQKEMLKKVERQTRENRKKAIKDLKNQIENILTTLEKTTIQNEEKSELIKWAIEETEKNIKQINDLNRKMIETNCDVNIKGLEHHMELNKKYETYKKSLNSKESNEEVLKKAIEVKNEKAKILEKEHHFIEKVEMGKNMTTIASVVGALIGSKTLVDVGVVSEVVIGIGEELMNIAGLGIPCRNPLKACYSIASVGMGLVNRFSRKSESNHTILMEQLSSIKEQIEMLRKEMHERFKEIDEKLDKICEQVYVGFTNLELATNLTHWQPHRLTTKVEEIDSNLLKGHEQVNKLLSNIAKQIHDEQHEKTFKKLSKILFIITTEETPNYDEYKKRVQDLEEIAMNFSKNPKNNLQEPILRETLIDPEFSIQYFYKKFTNEKGTLVLPHPTLFTLAALGILMLTIIQYPSTIVNENYRIANEDIRRLEALQKQLNELKEGIVEIRKTSYLQNLLENYKQSVDKTLTYLKQKKSEYINQKQVEINFASHQRHLGIYQSTEQIEKFQNPIEFTTNPKGGSWFSNQTLEEISHKGKGTFWHPEHGWCNKYVTTYIDNNKKQAMEQIKNYLTLKETNKFREYTGKFEISSGSQNNNIELPWFIEPHRHGFPLLPVPENFKKYIPNTIIKACASNLGYLQFTYTIEKQEKTTLLITMRFVHKPNPSIVFRKLKVPLNLSIYEDMEGLWWAWMGGNYPDQLEGKHRREFYGHSQNNECYMHCNHPIVEPHVGILDTFDQIEMEVNTFDLNEVEKLLENFQKKIVEQITQKLILSLPDNDCSMNSLNLELISFLLIAYKDQAEDLSCPLGNWINNPSFSSNTYMLKKKLQTNTNFSIDDLKTTFTSSLNTLQSILNNLPVETPKYLNEATTTLIDSMIQHYKPTAVTYNKWYQSQDDFKVQDNLSKNMLAMLFDVLKMAKDNDQVSSADIIERANLLKQSMERDMAHLSRSEQSESIQQFLIY
mmetsp:Transcript_4810/g.7106  ORF Transcript_4810/g.7106 Transcript_4810/m.7106 type:complete len:1119 (+) Transcript_4810:80-3436(+)